MGKKWRKHYDALLTFREEHGHCAVPQRYGPNLGLGHWVMQQRRYYSLQQLGERSAFNGPEGEERRRLLEEVDFAWSVERRGPRGARGGRRFRLGAYTASSDN